MSGALDAMIINLVLLDVVMHGMSGPELADYLEGMGVASLLRNLLGLPEGYEREAHGFGLGT